MIMNDRLSLTCNSFSNTIWRKCPFWGWTPAHLTLILTENNGCVDAKHAIRNNKTSSPIPITQG